MSQMSRAVRVHGPKILKYCACLGLLSGALSAEPAFELGRDLPYQLHVDRAGTLTVDALMALPDSAFEWRNRPLTQGYSQNVHWLKWSLSAEQFDAHPQLWMKVIEPYLDVVQLFTREPGQPWQLQQQGDRIPIQDRAVDYRQFIFVLPKPEGPILELVIRLESTSSHLMTAHIMPPIPLFEAAARETAHWSFYFGMVAVALIMALVMWLVLKTQLMLALLMFTFSNFLLVTNLYGILNWAVLRGVPQVAEQIVSVSMIATMASTVWLMREAFIKPLQKPISDAIMRLGIGINVLSFIIIPANLYSQVIPYNHLLTHVLIWFTLVHVLMGFRRMERGYGLIGLAALIYAVSTLGASLSVLGVLPNPGVFYSAWHYSLLLLVFMILVLAGWQLREEAKTKAERLALEKELIHIRKSSALQQQFVRLVSHEFLNPLGVVIMQAKMARQLDAPDSETLAHKMVSIERAAIRLKKLFHHWINTNRLLEETTVVHKQTVQLNHWLPWIVREGLLQTDREVTFALADLSGHIDPELMTFAINNLVENACKYSPEQTPIEIRLTQREGQIGISVLDLGPGVAPEQRRRLFERHTRQQGSMNELGMGLGLFLVQMVAQAHGGFAEYSDIPGYGSCFTIWAPAS